VTETVKADLRTNNKTREYRELLNAFTVAHMSWLRTKHQAEIEEGRSANLSPVPTGEELESYRVSRNRLSTARELEKGKHQG
jgi:hypothetical protein